MEHGYGAAHVKLRRQWAAQVDTGRVSCGRCGLPIAVGEPWDLSHPGDDKSIAAVPWCRRCDGRYAATVNKRRKSREAQVQTSGRPSRAWSRSERRTRRSTRLAAAEDGRERAGSEMELLTRRGIGGATWGVRWS